MGDAVIEWTRPEVDVFRSIDQVRLTQCVPDKAPPLPTRAAEALQRLQKTVDATERDEKRAHVRYTAATLRQPRSNRKDPWEDGNRPGDDLLALASAAGDCISSAVITIQALRNDMREIAASAAVTPMHWEDVMLRMFAGTTRVVQELEKGFRSLMPTLMNTSISSKEEPRTLLNDLHHEMLREMEQPLGCGRNGEPVKSFSLRLEHDAGHSRIPPLSTLCDKTPQAYELLMTPRSLLPTPATLHRYNGPTKHKTPNPPPHAKRKGETEPRYDACVRNAVLHATSSSLEACHTDPLMTRRVALSPRTPKQIPPPCKAPED